MDDESIYDLLINLIEFMSIKINDEETYQLISAYFKDLLVDVCLVLMMSTETETKQMKDDPEQFVSLALDTCDK